MEAGAARAWACRFGGCYVLLQQPVDLRVIISEAGKWLICGPVFLVRARRATILMLTRFGERLMVDA